MMALLTCEITVDGKKKFASIQLPFTVGDTVWEAGEEYVNSTSHPKVFGPFLITGMNLTLTAIGGGLEYYESGEEDVIRPIDAFATKREAQAMVASRKHEAKLASL